MANLILKPSTGGVLKLQNDAGTVDALSVSTGGNLTAAGTLGVTGAVTASSTLGVTGNTTLSGTTNNIGTVTAGTFNSVIGTSATGFGLVTHASQWRLTTSKTHTGEEAITANLEAVDTDNPGQIGSAMTESSGVFSFPVTGIWFIRFDVYGRSTSGAASYGEAYIDVDVGAGYSRAGTGITSSAATNDYMGMHANILFDVTSTSSCKVKFLCGFPLSCQVAGTSALSITSMTFIRLGDT